MCIRDRHIRNGELFQPGSTGGLDDAHKGDVMACHGIKLDLQVLGIAAMQTGWVNTVDDMLGEKIAVGDSDFYVSDPATGKRRIRSAETLSLIHI